MEEFIYQRKRKFLMHTKHHNKNGITLIALVITIVVLLILASVSITAVFGDNGLLEMAKRAGESQERVSIQEQIKMQILNQELKNNGNNQNFTEEQIKELLSQYGTINYNEDGTIKSITPFDKEYEIGFDELYQGELLTKVKDYSINIQNAKEQKVKNLIIYGYTLDDGTKLGQNGKIELVITGKNMVSSENADKEIEMMSPTASSGYNQYDYNVSSGITGIVGTNRKIAISFLLQKCNDVETENNGFSSIVFGGLYNGDPWAGRIGMNNFKIQKYDDNFDQYFTSVKLSSKGYYQNPIKFLLDTTYKLHIKIKNVQVEYGEKTTEFEPYKERRYVVELKDINGNVIDGIGKNETIQKINNNWVIKKEDTNIILDDSTCNVLENITINDGISNVFIQRPGQGNWYTDDTVLQTDIPYIEFEYLKSN